MRTIKYSILAIGVFACTNVLSQTQVIDSIERVIFINKKNLKVLKIYWKKSQLTDWRKNLKIKPIQVFKGYDFLYYLIYKFYSRKEKGADSSSAAIIGGLQAINVLSIIFIISGLAHQKIYGLKLIAIGICMLFQITTYIQYIYKKSSSLTIIEAKWLRKSEAEKTRIRVFAFLYIALSIIVFFGLAIYFGNQNR